MKKKEYCLLGIFLIGLILIILWYVPEKKNIERFQISDDCPVPKNCPKYPDMSQYVLKSSVPPCQKCPDMSQYLLKSELPVPAETLDMTKYILKTECLSCANKKCPDCICPDCDELCVKSKQCPPCPEIEITRCPDLTDSSQIIYEGKIRASGDELYCEDPSDFPFSGSDTNKHPNLNSREAAKKKLKQLYT